MADATIPTAWVAWKTAARKLLAAIVCHTDSRPADRLPEGVTKLPEALPEYRRVASGVGDDANRAKVSATLARAAADVVRLADNVPSGQAGSRLPFMNEVDRLAARLNDPIIDDQMLAAAQTGEGTGTGPVRNSIVRDGDVWKIRYEDEQRTYQDRNAIGWLAIILARPNHRFTVADLRGDPEGKLAGDAALRGERESDERTVRDIKRELEDLDDIIADTGEAMIWMSEGRLCSTS